MGNIQMILILAVFQYICLAKSKPFLGGITFKKEYDIGFKPLLIRPFAFIKEKWSPFGVFGSKHAIAKRSLEDINKGIPKIVINNDNLPRLPDEITENLESSSSEVFTYHQVFPGGANAIGSYEKGLSPDLAQLPMVSDSGLHTDITKADHVNNYLKSVERPIPAIHPVNEKVLPPLSINSIEPEKGIDIPVYEVDETSNSIVKGSKIALSLGNAIFQIITHFLTRARPSIDELFNRPPSAGKMKDLI